MISTKAKKAVPPLLLWLFVLLGVKLLGLALDFRPQIYQGDSMTFVATALTGYIPPERSFTYGFLLIPLAVWPHTFHLIVFTQAMLSGFSAWSVALILMRYFGASFRLAAIMSLLCAIEPFQLLYERYLMTEAVSVFLFSLFLLTALQYLTTRRLGWLCLVQVLGVFLISIRISYLPLALLASLALPFLTRPAFDLMVGTWQRRSFDWRGLAIPVFTHVLVALVLSQTLLYGYRCLNGALTHWPPAYIYEDGIFMLAEVAPIVKEEDFPIVEDRESIFGHPKFPLADRYRRGSQRWDKEGVCQILRSRYGEMKGNALAHATALHAVERDPLGELELAALTYRDFFDYNCVRGGLLGNEDYTRPVGVEDIKTAMDHFGEDFSHPNPIRDTLTKIYYRTAVPFVQILVLLPLVFAAYLLYRGRRGTPYHWICLVAACSFLATGFVTVESVNPRYLTNLAWIAFIIFGAVISDLTRRSPST